MIIEQRGSSSAVVIHFTTLSLFLTFLILLLESGVQRLRVGTLLVR